MSPVSRRTLLTGSAAAAASVLAGVGFVDTASAGGGGHGSGTPVQPRTYRLTVMGTTDLHGNVFNWDYFKNAEYDDSAHNDIGLAKVSTLVNAVRKQRGRRNTLLIDAGDTIQGTPLAYYYAKIKPISRRVIHPMAAAMNVDGLRLRRPGQSRVQLRHPLPAHLAGPAGLPAAGCECVGRQDRSRGVPARTRSRWSGPIVAAPIKVGILGLTNPGIAIWDKANVEGKMTFDGLVEQAKTLGAVAAPRVDVLLVAAHSGADTSSSYGDALPYPENASTLVAQQVPGHRRDPGRARPRRDPAADRHQHHNRQARRAVPNRCSGASGCRVFDVDLNWDHRHGWQVTGPSHPRS